MVRWGYPFNLIVLEAGDEFVAHSGAKGSIGRQAPAYMIYPEPDPVRNQDEEKEDPKLQPWADWLDSVDFGSSWDKDEK